LLGTSEPKEGAVVARKEVAAGRTEDPQKDDVLLGFSGQTALRREQCDRFGVSYAMTSQNTWYITCDCCYSMATQQFLTVKNS
jgi:plasmid replication initiation protein